MYNIQLLELVGFSNKYSLHPILLSNSNVIRLVLVNITYLTYNLPFSHRGPLILLSPPHSSLKLPVSSHVEFSSPLINPPESVPLGPEVVKVVPGRVEPEDRDQDVLNEDVQGDHEQPVVSPGLGEHVDSVDEEDESVAGEQLVEGDHVLSKS